MTSLTNFSVGGVEAGDAPRFQRIPTLAFQRIGDEVIVLVPRSRQVHLLNETGVFLWIFLESPRSLEECAQVLCEEYDVEREEAKRCVQIFLKQLMEKKMVGKIDI